MTPDSTLLTELEALRIRLAENEEMLKAIGSGQVDALVVSDEVHVLKGSAHPYRIIREQLAPGAVVTSDGHLLYPNRLFLKLVRMKEGSPGPADRLILPEQRADFHDALREGVRVETRRSLTLVSSDGISIPVEVDFHPTMIDGVAGCCLIIRDQKGFQRAGDAQYLPDASVYDSDLDELRYRMIADLTPHVVWTARPDGYRDYYNRRWFELTGLSLEESKGDGWQQAIHADDVSTAEHYWRQALTNGQGYEIELRFRSAPETAYRWYLARAIPIKDSAGQIVKWFGAATDITDRKKVEFDLVRLSRELERSNEALSQFAHVASHDLQEPLHKITAYAGLVKESPRLTPREQKFLDSIEQATVRMARLIEDVLSYSKITAASENHERIDLAALVTQVVEDLEARINQKNGAVTAEALPDVSGNRTQMRQLFLNLISNALKFSKKNEPPRITIRAGTVRDGHVEIRVQDNGIGFEPRFAAAIFEPFRRLHSRTEYEGTGFGLATCKRIVEAHGGEIRAESQPDQGATFILTLPVPRQ